MAQLSKGGGEKVTAAGPPCPRMARASTRTGSLTRQAGSLSCGPGVAAATRLPGAAAKADRHEASVEGVTGAFALGGAAVVAGGSAFPAPSGTDRRNSGGRGGGFRAEIGTVTEAAAATAGTSPMPRAMIRETRSPSH